MRRLRAERLKSEGQGRDAKAVSAMLQKHAVEAFDRIQKKEADSAAAVRALQLEAKKNGSLYVPAEPKVALVIRIRGVTAISPKVRTTLRLLRLTSINSASFVKLNKATRNMLKLVEPYVTYGYPTVSTVRDLILKRGYAKINGDRIPITSNEVIARRLSDHGVSCMAELIDEIASCGPAFSACNRFLYPIHLKNPTGGRRKIGTHFVEGGDCGDRMEHINELAHRML